MNQSTQELIEHLRRMPLTETKFRETMNEFNDWTLWMTPLNDRSGASVAQKLAAKILPGHQDNDFLDMSHYIGPRDMKEKPIVSEFPFIAEVRNKQRKEGKEIRARRKMNSMNFTELLIQHFHSQMTDDEMLVLLDAGYAADCRIRREYEKAESRKTKIKDPIDSIVRSSAFFKGSKCLDSLIGFSVEALQYNHRIIWGSKFGNFMLDNLPRYGHLFRLACKNIKEMSQEEKQELLKKVDGLSGLNKSYWPLVDPDKTVDTIVLQMASKKENEFILLMELLKNKAVNDTDMLFLWEFGSDDYKENTLFFSHLKTVSKLMPIMLRALPEVPDLTIGLIKRTQSETEFIHKILDYCFFDKEGIDLSGDITSEKNFKILDESNDPFGSLDFKNFFGMLKKEYRDKKEFIELQQMVKTGSPVKMKENPVKRLGHI